MVNSPEELMKSEGMKAMMEGADDEAIVPSVSLRIETKSITSVPMGIRWICNLSARHRRDVALCVLHPWGRYGVYPALMRITSLGQDDCPSGIAVMMVDFRNCLSPSSSGEVAPFLRDLTTCVGVSLDPRTGVGTRY